MATILEQIQNPRSFDAFINENMKTSTYKIGWDAYMEVEYEASKNWSAATADYAAAMLGSVIGRDADRVKHDMPSIGELSGVMDRMGDEWQMPNDRLEQYYYMENRFRDRIKTLTSVQKEAQYEKLVKFLFNPYELAAIAPHRRILSRFLEGVSDAQITLTKTNNAGALVWAAALPTGIEKKNLRSSDVVWSAATLATMDVVAVLQYQEDRADAAGKTIIEHWVSKATAQLICTCNQFKNLIGLNQKGIKTDTTPGIGLDMINMYLATVGGTGLAPIRVIDEKGILPDGTPFKMFKDGRVASICTDKIAVLKVSDPLELVDGHPNKVYASYADNLLSQWRSEHGRMIAYEMFAFPAFVGHKSVFVIDVTQKDS